MPGDGQSAYRGAMKVTFTRTGTRRYGVFVAVPGQEVQGMDPAPGYDEDIPHDLVHYVLEAELGLGSGVFGRTAKGGGGFIRQGAVVRDPRERRRQRRKQHRREDGLRRRDHAGSGDMAVSERFAAICSVAWKRRHGHKGEAAVWLHPEPLPAGDEAAVERVLTRLDEVAQYWRALREGESLTFNWPSVTVESEAATATADAHASRR